MPPYNWIYTTSNDNIYILILVIIILGFIIIDFGLWKKKTDKFYDITIPKTTIPQTTSKTTIPQTTQTPQTTKPQPTIYQAPMLDNLMNPNFYISKEEEARRNAWSQLDGNEETLFNTNGSNSNLSSYQNDITQLNSTLFNNSNSTPQSNNYATIGDYATLDTLGKSLTDTLGGIKSDMGYTILDEQLGTFNKYSINNSNNNPHTYDNTANFKTGMNAATVDGTTSGLSSNGSGLSGQFTQDNKPIFLQKDFQGVANIFAPNIIISNPPLTSDGNPDISFQM